MYRVILVVESVILLLYAAVCMNGCMDIENKLLIRAICRLVIIELQAPHRSGERATITAMSSESYCLCYPALSNIIRSYCSIPSSHPVMATLRYDVVWRGMLPLLLLRV